MERFGAPDHPLSFVQPRSLNGAEIRSAIRHRPVPVFSEPLNFLEVSRVVDGLVQFRLDHVLKLATRAVWLDYERYRTDGRAAETGAWSSCSRRLPNRNDRQPSGLNYICSGLSRSSNLCSWIAFSRRSLAFTPSPKTSRRVAAPAFPAM